jgi:hypothetical protein
MASQMVKLNGKSEHATIEYNFIEHCLRCDGISKLSLESIEINTRDIMIVYICSECGDAKQVMFMRTGERKIWK